MSQVWYSDRRLSWPLVLLGGMVLAGLGVCIAMNPSSFFLYLAGELVVGFVLMNFFEVRIIGVEKSLYVEYGLGLLKKEVPLFHIAKAEPVENENIFCLLYSPFERQSLLLTFREGGKMHIPCPHPKELARSLGARGAGVGQ